MKILENLFDKDRDVTPPPVEKPTIKELPVE